jgi:hypothetical protein
MSDYETCGMVEVRNTNFTGNAVRGGGGAAVMLHARLTGINIICNTTRSENERTDGIPVHDPSEVHESIRSPLPCTYWPPNAIKEGAYGPVMATDGAYHLRMLTATTKANYLSSSVNPVEVVIQDFYNQTITRSDILISAKCDKKPEVMAGVNVMAAKNGVGNFSQVTVRAQPGTYIVAFETDVLGSSSRPEVVYEVREHTSAHIEPLVCLCD